MPVIITGAKDIKRKVAGIRRRAAHPDPVWPRVGRVVRTAVKKQFATQGAYFGTPWKPLTPEYLFHKLSQGFPPTILVASGNMRSTFTSNPMNIQQYMGKRAVFGSSNQKAVWHHHGTHRNGRPVNPPRPILKATQPLAKDVAVVVGKYIAGYNTKVL